MPGQARHGGLKQRLAEEFPDDMNAYVEGKDSFVKYHQARALLWRGGHLAETKLP